VDNRTLGRFHLDGIPPAPRGVPQIEVTFDIDANGVLNVSAKDKATGKEQKIRIESSSGLSDPEIDKMKEAAQEHADEDEKLRDRIEKLNKADGLIFSTKKQLDEYGDKISDVNKTKIKDALSKLEELHKNEKVDELDDAMEALNQAWSAASTEMYQATADQQQGQQAPGGQEQAAGGEGEAKAEEEKGDEAVDADFEVVDDEDKDK